MWLKVDVSLQEENKIGAIHAFFATRHLHWFGAKKFSETETNTVNTEQKVHFPTHAIRYFFNAVTLELN